MEPKPQLIDTAGQLRPDARLARGEPHFRALVENAPGALVVLDREGRISYASPGVTRILDYAPEELIGVSGLDLIHPQDRARVLEIMTRTIDQPGYTDCYEYRVLRKDGVWRTVQATSVNRLADPQIGGIITETEDITERKGADAQPAVMTRQLWALTRMGQSVLASLDLDTVLQQVVEELSPLLPTPDISILLWEGDELVFEAVGGQSAVTLKGYRMPASLGIAGQALSTRRMVYVQDVHAQARENREVVQLTSYEPMSVLAVPLCHGEQVLGVVEAVSQQSGGFAEEHLRLMEMAAQWAAIAISNARRHREQGRQLQETQALAEINLALSDTLDLDLILQRVVESAQTIIQTAQQAVIHLLDEEDQILYPVATAGGHADELASAHMRPGEGIAGQALASGQTINVPDVSRDKRYVSRIGSAPDRSLLVAPLQSGARRMGTISVQSKAQSAFSQDDERLLTQFAIQVSIALQNARLFAETQTRASQMALLYDAGLALSSVLDRRAQLGIMFRVALRVVGADYAAYFRYMEETGELYYEDDLASAESQSGPAVPPLSSGDLGGILSWVASQRRPLALGDLQNDPRWRSGPPTGMHSGMWVPLLRQERLVGVLAVLSQKPNAFTPDHERLLGLFANQVAVALENARLYAELQEALRQEQATRAQLVLADKLSGLGRMVATVAHELNSPLQSLRNCIYIARQPNRPSESREHYLQIAIGEIDRLSELITQLRSVYQNDPHAPRLKQPIGELLDGVCELVRPHMVKHHVTCEVTASPQQLLQIGVPVRLRQVFINLCLNAVDAMQPAGGAMGISVQESVDGSEIGIVVRDAGCGIQEEDLPHIFEPFFTTKASGVGLGLAICYDVVQANAGRLVVESQPGRGSTFTVWLPRPRANAEEE